LNIETCQTKDGKESLLIDGIYYHSKYAPEKEAERFVSSISIPFLPKLIFIIEPGLNYTITYLKKAFPTARLAAIRLLAFDFSDNSGWDYEIFYKKEQNLKQKLLNNFGEEALLSSTILIWPPANNLFSNEIEEIISNYKEALNDSKTLLVTRQFFEKKWLINSFNFIKYSNNLLQPELKINYPVLICASGPSLEKTLPIILKNRKAFFLICLSSATKVLLKNNIIPDLVLSTDGGYWAGKHLKALTNTAIPLACPCEAFIPKKILKTNPILALEYKDSSSFICKEIMEKASIKAFKAERNPTVSGTALYFAKALTNSQIFFCGLDLAGNKGLQHTRPNELEFSNSLKDNRIKSKESRITPAIFNDQALKIYQEWFASLNDVEQVVRVIDKEYKKNSLGQIKDISSQEFQNIAEKLKAAEKPIHFTKENINQKNTSELLDFIIQRLEEQKWQRQLFPADFISMENTSDSVEKEKIKEKLNSKILKLTEKLRKLADD